MTDLFDRFRVIDVDTHLTEPADLWTSRVPSKMVEQVPRIERRGDLDVWMVGDQFIGAPGAYSMAGFDGDYNIQRPLAPLLPRAGYWTVPGGDSRLVLLDYSLLTVDAVPALVPTPFFLNARLRVIDAATRLPLFDDTVFGSGTATWTYLTSPANVISRVRYEFEDAAPTPEPSTLLLIGSGLAALAARRRHPRRSERS